MGVVFLKKKAQRILTLFPLGTFCMLFSSADFFFKINLFREKIRNNTRVADSLEPDQAGRFVGQVLGSKLFAKVISGRH